MKKVDKCILLAIILVLWVLSFGFTHEYVHIEIFEEYDIKVKQTNYLTYVEVDSIEYNSKCTDSCRVLHSLNEFSHFILIVGLLILALKMFDVVEGEGK